MNLKVGQLDFATLQPIASSYGIDALRSREDDGAHPPNAPT